MRPLGHRRALDEPAPQTGRPTVFVYDGHAGGVGITERGFEQFEGWVATRAQMVAGCPCADGCPSCVQSPKCGNLNEMLDKARRATLLARLVGSRSDPSTWGRPTIGRELARSARRS